MPEPFTPKDLKDAMERLSMLKFWPSDAGTQSRIMEVLASKVPHKEALEWLVAQFVERIGQWHGPSELLGVLDQRYRPTDGKSYWSQIPGYTAADGEARYYETVPQLDAPICEESRNFLRQLSKAKEFPK